jgi:hypothetical protein
MSSRRSAGADRRHVVLVEDQLYHITEMLDALRQTAPELLAWTAVCAIEAPGTDTTRAAASWLEQYPALRVSARLDPRELPDEIVGRFTPLESGHVQDLAGFARGLASMLLPGGILVQDIHLSTLPFVPQDRWWESIYAAATVRGMFADRPPAVRFLSNKRGYTATFGRDLMDAGFDPRDVMDKSELTTTVIPTLERDVRERFPLGLEAGTRAAGIVPISAHDASRRELEETIDLIEWSVSGRLEIAGRLLKAPVVFRTGSHEAITWQALIADRLDAGEGVPVLEVGRRLAAEGAERAEASNQAARHAHLLRSRLSDPGALVTVNHTYRLHDRLVVGRVRPR